MQRYKYYRIYTNNSILINVYSIIFDINQYTYIVMLMKIRPFFNKAMDNT